jgi:hypothetical protein
MNAKVMIAEKIAHAVVNDPRSATLEAAARAHFGIAAIVPELHRMDPRDRRIITEAADTMWLALITMERERLAAKGNAG